VRVPKIVAYSNKIVVGGFITNLFKHIKQQYISVLSSPKGISGKDLELRGVN
jgi:hypothetical protein